MNISMTPQEHREAEAFCEEIKRDLGAMIARGHINTRLVHLGGFCLIEISFTHACFCNAHFRVHAEEYKMQLEGSRDAWRVFVLESLLRQWAEAYFLKGDD